MTAPPQTPEPSALLEEALKRTDFLWVGPVGGRSHGVWHVWDDGSVWVLGGGSEQPLPVEPGEPAVVIIRSKDKGTRLLSVAAAAELVGPGDDWDRIAGNMATRRLNLPGGEDTLGRWARECRLLRLRLDPDFLEAPGHYDSGSNAAPPPPTPATTRVPRPWHLFGRPGRRRTNR